jgi:hypothetical protein
LKPDQNKVLMAQAEKGEVSSPDKGRRRFPWKIS